MANVQYNMGPFPATSFKGGAAVNGVPVFVDKLPLTLGGIAGEDLHFGRVVSIDPSTPGGRREFVEGCPAGNVIKGIVIINPAIMRADPGMNDYYFAGRPATVAVFGIVEISEYDITQSVPVEGSTVWANNTNGLLAFNDGTDISASGYTKLNAYVYETFDPNGAKIFFNVPFIVTQTAETVTQVATPAATPGAGAVASGTKVSLATTTAGATIHYTIDGTAPTMSSPVYDGTEIEITAPVTIKAIAVKEGMAGSALLTAAYTISA